MKHNANKGVYRNKKPLQNIIYQFNPIDNDKWELVWNYERQSINNWHGLLTLDQVKELLTPNQWSKFRQGETRFIKQRRINGKNVN